MTAANDLDRGEPSKARNRKTSEMIARGRMRNAVDVYTALPYI